MWKREVLGSTCNVSYHEKINVKEPGRPPFSTGHSALLPFERLCCLKEILRRPHHRSLHNRIEKGRLFFEWGLRVSLRRVRRGNRCYVYLSISVQSLDSRLKMSPTVP
jgi:hypothetical protein